MEIRVAGAQLALQKDIAENTAKILTAIEHAAADKAARVAHRPGGAPFPGSHDVDDDSLAAGAGQGCGGSPRDLGCVQARRR